MNRDDILRMALEAGIRDSMEYPHMECDEQSLERFAALVAAAEREACASICDRFHARDVGMQPAECAAAIRARGEK